MCSKKHGNNTDFYALKTQVFVWKFNSYLLCVKYWSTDTANHHVNLEKYFSLPMLHNFTFAVLFPNCQVVTDRTIE